MRKMFILRGAQVLVVVLLFALLGACGRNAISTGTSDIAVTDAPATYDLTVAADKDAQFEYEGATLSREDLAGHIRYLTEIGKPVHTILLIPGEKQKIKNEHVAALAGVCRDLKISGYVRDNDGRLKVLQIVQ